MWFFLCQRHTHYGLTTVLHDPCKSWQTDVYNPHVSVSLSALTTLPNGFRLYKSAWSLNPFFLTFIDSLSYNNNTKYGKEGHIIETVPQLWTSCTAYTLNNFGVKSWFTSTASEKSNPFSLTIGNMTCRRWHVLPLVRSSDTTDKRNIWQQDRRYQRTINWLITNTMGWITLSLE
jgi:hypothetical protein